MEKTGYADTSRTTKQDGRNFFSNIFVKDTAAFYAFSQGTEFIHEIYSFMKRNNSRKSYHGNVTELPQR